jgi:hypothetical protein
VNRRKKSGRKRTEERTAEEVRQKECKKKKKGQRDNCIRRIKIGHQNGEHGRQKRKRELSIRIRKKLRQKMVYTSGRKKKNIKDEETIIIIIIIIVIIIIIILYISCICSFDIHSSVHHTILIK